MKMMSHMRVVPIVPYGDAWIKHNWTLKLLLNRISSGHLNKLEFMFVNGILKLLKSISSESKKAPFF